ncbi:MAG TPA: UDP-2,4-diacetamido-2,4,6-trideoxy-beta-L-altropyranose hydrolase [Candidatus Thermoplasmatota archaeon]|nr:UDP-2,4-diacetamido-2,4,6-trideoxy-beta-L-altropyranose hydrolase [Candidatus Thermoplasmatota archaeon]
MKIAFRVDASPDIGIGHLMRCLALSEELRRRGHDCFFLLKMVHPEVLERIKKFECTPYLLPRTESLQQDLDSVIEYAFSQSIDWLITDHYQIDASYVKEIKHQGFRVLSIDDNAQMHYYSDIVLNQNIGAQKLTFSAEPYSKLLLGPSYVMLRDELLRRAEKKRDSTVKTMLVTLGGADPDNYLLSILHSLEDVTKNLDILAVIGPFNPHNVELQAFKQTTKMRLTLISSPRTMVDLYLRADLAISAAGTSSYELAYFGIPNLLITVADNQLSIAHEMDKQKVGLYLGEKHDLQLDLLKDKVKEFLKNQSLRNHMSENGQKLVDGKGKERIVDAMETMR